MASRCAIDDCALVATYEQAGLIGAYVPGIYAQSPCRPIELEGGRSFAHRAVASRDMHYLRTATIMISGIPRCFILRVPYVDELLVMVD
jgi:hypothetical protein